MHYVTKSRHSSFDYFNYFQWNARSHSRVKFLRRALFASVTLLLFILKVQLVGLLLNTVGLPRRLHSTPFVYSIPSSSSLFVPRARTTMAQSRSFTPMSLLILASKTSICSSFC